MFLSLTDSPAVVEDEEDQSEDNDSSLHVSNKVSTHVLSVDGIGLFRCDGSPVFWWCDLHPHRTKFKIAFCFNIQLRVGRVFWVFQLCKRNSLIQAVMFLSSSTPSLQ